jgi:hypothetical protein
VLWNLLPAPVHDGTLPIPNVAGLANYVYVPARSVARPDIALTIV